MRFFGRDLDDHLVYSYWINGAFQIELLPIPNANWSDLSILDTRDNLHMYRTASVPVPGSYVTGLYHQCLDNNMNWGPELVLSGYDDIWESTAPTRDSEGNVVFGWKEYNSNNFSLALLNGCSQPERKTGQLPASKSWGYLSAAAISSQPKKFCALAEIRLILKLKGCCVQTFSNKVAEELRRLGFP